MPRKGKGSANDAMTPLHFAAQKGSAEVVRLLLEAKANKDAATAKLRMTSMQPDMQRGPSLGQGSSINMWGWHGLG